jgi:hypothetical protein
MRHVLLAGLAVVILAGVVAAEEPPRHPRYPRWITSYEAARALARATGKPLFIVLRCEP